jgi:hypothetical protein
MFAVDEALFEVIAQVREERVKAARAQGRTLSTADLSPLTQGEVFLYASSTLPTPR